MSKTIIPLGAQIALPLDTNSPIDGSNVNEASLVYLCNTAAAGTNHLVSLSGDSGEFLGSFTLPGSTSITVKKKNLDRLAASNAAVVATPIGWA